MKKIYIFYETTFKRRCKATVLVALLLIFGLSATLRAQSVTVTYSSPGNYSTVIPSDATSANGTACGAGGGGGGVASSSIGGTLSWHGGGGGGGNSASGSLSTGPVNIIVGAGGPRGSNSPGPGTQGGPSSIGGISAIGGAGGGAGNNSNGSDGGNASSGNGGIGACGGAIGALPGSSNNGNPGGSPGGGGSGGYSGAFNYNSYYGGAGGDGRVIISFNLPTPVITGTASYCEGSNLNLSVQTPCSDFTYYWFLSGVQQGTGTTLTGTVPSAGNYTYTVVATLNSGYSFPGGSVSATGGITVSGNSIGGSITSTGFAVTVNPAHPINIGYSGTLDVNNFLVICPGGTTNLSAPLLGVNYAYSWSVDGTEVSTAANFPFEVGTCETEYLVELLITNTVTTCEFSGELHVKAGIENTPTITVLDVVFDDCFATEPQETDVWDMLNNTSLNLVTINDDCVSDNPILVIAPLGSISTVNCTKSREWEAIYTDACGEDATYIFTVKWKHDPLALTEISLVGITTDLGCNPTLSEIPDQVYVEALFNSTDPCDGTYEVQLISQDNAGGCKIEQTWRIIYTNVCGATLETDLVFEWLEAVPEVTLSHGFPSGTYACEPPMPIFVLSGACEDNPDFDGLNPVKTVLETTPGGKPKKVKWTATYTSSEYCNTRSLISASADCVYEFIAIDDTTVCYGVLPYPSLNATTLNCSGGITSHTAISSPATLGSSGQGVAWGPHDNYLIAARLGPNNATSQTLTLSGFNFGIPAGATITSIALSLIRNQGGGLISWDIIDKSVFLQVPSGSALPPTSSTSNTWKTNSVKTFSTTGLTSANINNISIDLIAEVNDIVWLYRWANLSSAQVTVGYTLNGGSTSWYDAPNGNVIAPNSVIYNPTTSPLWSSVLATPITAPLTTTVYANCSSYADCFIPVTYTINPKPVINHITKDICSGEGYTYEPENGVNGNIVPTSTTYSWNVLPTLPTGLSMQPSARLGTNEPDFQSSVFTNPTKEPLFVTYSVTPKIGNCAGDPFNVVIRVDPTPHVEDQEITICSGDKISWDLFDRTNLLIPDGTTYEVTYMPVNGIDVVEPFDFSDIEDLVTITNTTDETKYITFTVIPTAGICVGDPFDVKITVNPRPEILVSDIIVCSEATVKVGDLLSNVAGSTIPVGTVIDIVTPGTNDDLTINVLHAFPLSVNDAGILGENLFKFTNETNTTQYITYKMSATSGTGSEECVFNFDVTITVDPKPKILMNPFTVCSEQMVTVGDLLSKVDPSSIIPAHTIINIVSSVIPPEVITQYIYTNFPIDVNEPGILSANLFQFKNPTDQPKTITYTMSLTTVTPNCPGDNFTFNIILNQKPDVTVVGFDGDLGCNPAPEDFLTLQDIKDDDIVIANDKSSMILIVGEETDKGACSWERVDTVVFENTCLAKDTAYLTYTWIEFNPSILQLANPEGHYACQQIPDFQLFGACESSPDFKVEKTFEGLNDLGKPSAKWTATYTSTVECVGYSRSGTVVTATCEYSWDEDLNDVTVCAGELYPVLDATPLSCAASSTGSLSVSATAYANSNSNGGQNPWVIPGNYGSKAHVRLEINLLSRTSQELIATGFDFSALPAGADVTSVTLTMNRREGDGFAPGNISTTITGALPITPLPWSNLNPTYTISNGPLKTDYFINNNSIEIHYSTSRAFLQNIFSPYGYIDNIMITVNYQTKGGTISWYANPDGTGLLASDTAKYDPTKSTTLWSGGPLPNPILTQQEVTVYANCSSNPTCFVPVTYTINPKPLFDVEPLTVCSETVISWSDFTLINSIIPAGTKLELTYTEDLSKYVVTGLLEEIDLDSYAGESLATIKNLTDEVQPVTFNVTATSGVDPNKCSSTFNVVVNVNPMPKIPNQEITVCSGDVINWEHPDFDISGSTIPAGTIFTAIDTVVDLSKVTIVSTNFSNINNLAQIKNLTEDQQKVIFTVQATSGTPPTECSSTFTVDVTVNPKPHVEDQVITVCSGEVISWKMFDITNLNIPAGTTYTIENTVADAGIDVKYFNFSDPEDLAVINNTLKVSQGVIFTVKATSGSGLDACSYVFTVYVTVNPRPHVEDQVITVCSGEVISWEMFDITNLNIPAGTTYTIENTVADAGIDVKYFNFSDPEDLAVINNTLEVSQGVIFTVKATSGSGLDACSYEFTVDVTVIPNPSILFQEMVVCSDQIVTIGELLGNVVPGSFIPVGTEIDTLSHIVHLGSEADFDLTIYPTLPINVNTPGILGQDLFMFTNITEDPVVIEYTMRAKAGDCKSEFLVWIMVNPKSKITMDPMTVCSDQTIKVSELMGNVQSGSKILEDTEIDMISFTGAVLGTDFNVAVYPSLPINVNKPNILNENLFMFTNLRNYALTITYKMTATTVELCVDTFTFTVTVDPKPFIEMEDFTVCSEQMVTVGDLLSKVKSTSIIPLHTIIDTVGHTGAIADGDVEIEYLHTFPIDVNAPGILGENLFKFTNKTNQVQTIIFTMSDTAVCKGDNFTFEITLNQKPEITIDLSFGNLDCNPDPTDFLDIIELEARGIVSTSGVSGTLSLIVGVPEKEDGTCNWQRVDTIVFENACSYKDTAELVYSWIEFTPSIISTGSPSGHYTCEPAEPTFTLFGSCESTPDFDVEDVRVTVGSTSQVTWTATYTPSVCKVPPITETIVYTWDADLSDVTICDGENGTIDASALNCNSGSSSTHIAQSIATTKTTTGGGVNWTFPSGFFARTTLGWTFFSGQTSQTLIASGFDFNIPAGATINSIQVDINRAVQGFGLGNRINDTYFAVTDGSETIAASPLLSWNGTTTYSFTPTTNWNASNINNMQVHLNAQLASWVAVYVRGDVNSITVRVNYTINTATLSWYSDPDGLNLLTTGTNTYDPTTNANLWNGGAGLPATITTPQAATVYVNCSSSPECFIPVTLTINPNPYIPDQTITVCSEDMITWAHPDFNLAGSVIPAGTTFVEVSNNATSAVNIISTNFNDIDHLAQIENLTNSPKSVTFLVRATSGTAPHQCTSTFNVTVNVNPMPVIADATATICSGTSYAFTPASGDSIPAGTTYTWAAQTLPSGLTCTSGSTSGANASNFTSCVLANSSTSPIPVTYTVTASYGTNPTCSSTFDVTVNVNPVADLDPIIGPDEVCAVTTITYNVPVEPVSVSWDVIKWSLSDAQGAVIDGGVDDESSVSIISGICGTTFTLELYIKDNNGCEYTTDLIVTVDNPTPEIVVIDGVSGCNEAPTAYVIDACVDDPVLSAPDKVFSLDGKKVKYTWTYTSPVTCGGSATAEEIKEEREYDLVTLPDVTICDGDDATIDLTSFDCPDGTSTPLLAGPKSATGHDTEGTGNAWSFANTSYFATANLNFFTLFNTLPTNILIAKDFGFNLPPTATINSITVALNRSSSSLGWNNNIKDRSFAITNGIIGTKTEVVTGANLKAWNNTTPYLFTSPTGWTGADVNNMDVRLSAELSTWINFILQARIHSITVTVDYSVSTASLTWYSDAAGTDELAQGLSYNPLDDKDDLLWNGSLGIEDPITTPQSTTVYVNCSSNPDCFIPITLTINPNPYIPDQTITVCSEDMITWEHPDFNLAGSVIPAGTTFTAVDTTADLTKVIIVSTDFSDINNLAKIKNRTNSPQLVTFKVMATSGTAPNECTSTFFVNVNVNPTPDIPNQEITVCSGEQITWAHPDFDISGSTIPAGTNYIAIDTVADLSKVTIVSTNFNNISNLAQITNSTEDPQTVIFTVQATSGTPPTECSSTFTVEVTVNPVLPMDPIDGPDEVCAFSTTSYLIPDPPTSVPWELSSIKWSLDLLTNAEIDGADNASAVLIKSDVCGDSFTLTLSIQDENGCEYTTDLTVDVDNPKPVIVVIEGASGCTPAPTYYVIDACVENPIIEADTVTSPDGKTITYTLNYTSSASCDGTSPGKAATEVVLQYDLVTLPDLTICDGEDATLDASALACTGGTSSTILVQRFAVTKSSIAPGIAWTFPSGVFARTVLGFTLFSGQSSQTLTASGFNFNIPDDATINSIQVLINRDVEGFGIGNRINDTYFAIKSATKTITATPLTWNGTTTYSFTPTGWTGEDVNQLEVNLNARLATWLALSVQGDINSISAFVNYTTTSTNLNWYSDAAGTDSIFTGNTFDPTTKNNLWNSGAGLPNPITTPQTTTVYANCSSNPDCFVPITLTINPKPFIEMEDDFTVCSEEMVTVADLLSKVKSTSIIPVNTEIDTVSHSGAIVAGNVSIDYIYPTFPIDVNTPGILSEDLFKFKNLTDQPQIIIYTLSVASPDCEGEDFTFKITVTPKPEIEDQAITVCSGDIITWAHPDFDISGSKIPVGTTYTMISNDANPLEVDIIFTDFNDPDNLAQLDNLTTLPQVVTFKIAATSGSGSNLCTSTFEVVVTVKANNNTISLITGNSTQIVRAGNPIVPITYNTTGATGATILWVPSTPAGINFVWDNDEIIISGTPTDVDTFHYTITLTGGCGLVTIGSTVGTLIVKEACPTTVTHFQNGNSETYNVVEAGGRCWYRENVRDASYETGGGTIPFAQIYNHPLYPNLAYNLANFGRLYTYDDVFAAGKSLCQAGWSIPTPDEWALLTQYPIEDLKTAGFWIVPNGNTNATDFSAMGAGFYNGTTLRFEDMLGYTGFWASDASNTGGTTAIGFIMTYYCGQLEICEIKKINAISVRCIMDE